MTKIPALRKSIVYSSLICYDLFFKSLHFCSLTETNTVSKIVYLILPISPPKPSKSLVKSYAPKSSCDNFPVVFN